MIWKNSHGILTVWYWLIIALTVDTTVSRISIFALMEIISVWEQDWTDSLIIAVDELTIVVPLPLRLELCRI